MNPYLQLLRPQQWIKNLVVLLPMFFDGKLLVPDYWGYALLGVVIFTLASAGVYCFNDTSDARFDRLHPVKKFRPVASGAVKPSMALGLGCVLMLGALGCCCVFDLSKSLLCIATVGGYLLMNIAYTLWLRQISIIDIMVVAMGFVLRVVLGGIVCSIALSPWIVCMTFLLTLLLAIGRRRDDVLLQETGQKAPRATTSRYNLAFINQVSGVLAAVTIVCYLMYCVAPETVARFNNGYVYTTALFVVLGILRYLQMMVVDNNTGDPTALLMSDPFIKLCAVCWLINFFIIIYVWR